MVQHETLAYGNSIIVRGRTVIGMTTAALDGHRRRRATVCRRTL